MEREQTVVVFVTDQESCIRLIQTGERMAKAMDAEIRVLSIQKSGGVGNGTALDVLYRAACSAGAEMTVYYHDDVLQTAKTYLQRCAVAGVVLGDPGNADTGFINCVRETLPHTPLWLVDAQGGIIHA